MRVYLDNAASTPLDPDVLAAMMPYLTEVQGNPSSVHSHGRTVRAAIEQARRTIAECMGCTPAEIVFTSGGTEADNMALKGCAAAGHIRRIITSPLEHHAITHTAETCAQLYGTEIVWLKPDTRGNLSLSELESYLKDSTVPTLISLMHGNNEIGTLNDIAAIARMGKQYGALVHTDAVQTVGHLPVNLADIPVDMLSASAHKFNGPKGVGFFFRRAEAPQLPTLICGGSQERNQRAGTEAVPAIIGMAAALKKSVEHLPEKTRHLLDLKQYFMQGLRQHIPGVDFNGETADDRALPTVLNVAFPGTDDEALLLYNLDIYQISASGGSACTSGAVGASHVLTALGHSPLRMAHSIRFSFGYQNTREEIDYVMDKLRILMADTVQA
ncbi:MAG: cysteine desulfurase [Bacteroidetes bacterium]|nr:cysteine desulfurase [Bacteroidota bacterium]